jgi:methionyl-tRNA formyltransferase
MSDARIVFLGSDPIALPALEWLASAGSPARVSAVITQPDRPSGRGQSIRPGPIKRWALDRSLPVRQPERLGPQDEAWFAEHGADLALVMAFGQILREGFLTTPPRGVVNLHASLLPRYRGASPIQTAVACGERSTGVSLMRVVRRLDAGPVADAETVPIGPRDTAADVEVRIAQACVPLLARTLGPLLRGELRFHPQDEAGATRCRRLGRGDGSLDFRAGAAELAARINGMHPWPSCAVAIRGQSIRLGLAEADATTTDREPGAVLGADAEGLLVATGRGTLRLLRLQRHGGRMLPAPEFLRGFPLHPGEVLASEPMSVLLA